ncbi:MAG: tetratricopeptide repeat protein, partial [Phycisphaerales bacterium]
MRCAKASLAAALACSSWLAGCASKPGSDSPAPSGRVAAEESDPLLALDAAQRSNPDELASALKAPDWADGPAVQILPIELRAEGAKSTLPLDKTLEAFRAGAVQPPPSKHVADVEALHLYSQGRLKAADRKLPEAITDLEAAAALDPGAAEIWRALGEAQLAAGRRQNGLSSFAKALSLGLNESMVHWLLGREKLRAKQWNEALASLVHALDAPDLRPESDLAVLVRLDLAEALAATGSLSAAREMIGRALSVPFSTLAYSRFRGELAEVFRRRSEFWTRAGDLACRMGQYEDARQDYAQAAALSPVDPVGVSLRMVWADLARGHSAGAAQFLLSSLVAAQGRIDERQVSAIATVASLPSVGRAVSSRLRAMAAESSISPTVAARLTRAAAAAAGPDESRRLLRDLVQLRPWDGAPVVDLLAAAPVEDDAGRLRELLLLTKSSPVDAPVYASAALALGRGVDDLAASLAGDASAEAGLLRAYLLAALGKPAEALDAARRIAGEDAAKWRCVAEIAVAAGEYATARDACSKLPLQNARDVRAAVSAWAASGNPDESAKASEKELSLLANNAPAARLIAAAQARLGVGDSNGAEQLLKRALEVDTFDEATYEALIEAYAPGSPLADNTKLTATGRSL